LKKNSRKSRDEKDSNTSLVVPQKAKTIYTRFVAIVHIPCTSEAFGRDLVMIGGGPVRFVDTPDREELIKKIEQAGDIQL
jgi:hypothetical protein